ncbi:PIN domain-containing protein [Streptomyces microflavus]|uniref:PIN domain-containing protein n=1 Tax=Streptomyces microflavus TaxID=1919 RepID=UPI0033A5141D
MIILDANIIKGISLRGPVADVLRTIRAAGVERVATPWIAVEEVAAQEALRYREKHDAAKVAVDVLRKATPWADVPHPKRWPAEHVRRHWREQYGSITDVMETSADAYKQALYRETNLIAPCKTVNNGKDKTGARDAAIWLTAVEYAAAHAGELVHFVSNDKDFSVAGKLPDEMQRDIKGMEGRFSVFTSLQDVVNKFATEVEASEKDVRELLDTEESHATVLEATRTAAGRHRLFTGSLLSQADGDTKLSEIGVSRWYPTAVVLDKVLTVSGHEVGDHRYFTAWVRWLLRDDWFRGEEPGVAYSWETRVLLSTATDKSMTVLDSKRPGPIALEDVPNLPTTLQAAGERLRRLREDDELSSLLHTPDMRAYLSRLAQQATPLSTIQGVLDSNPAQLSMWERLAEPVRNFRNLAPEDDE